MIRAPIAYLAGALCVSVALGFTVKACSSPELVETLGEKSEWSALQAIEAQTRHQPLGEPVLRTIADREVLGVRGAAGENIWILMRTEAPPFYKQLPVGQYDLPAALVENLARERRFSYTVGGVLRSHVRQP